MSRDIQQPRVANGEVTGADAVKQTEVPGIIVKKTKKEGEYLHVFLQAKDCQALSSSIAQRVAYDARLEFGFENAGIDPGGTTSAYAVDLAELDEDGLPGKQVPHTAQALTELSARSKDMAYEVMVSLRRGMR